MAWAPEVDRNHMVWMMQQIEARCQNPDAANLLRIKGRFDLEIVIVVAPEDRCYISSELIGERTTSRSLPGATIRYDN